MHATTRHAVASRFAPLALLFALFMTSCAPTDGADDEPSGAGVTAAEQDDLARRTSDESSDELDEASTLPKDYLYDLDEGAEDKAACRYSVVWCKNPGGSDFCHNKALCRTTASCYGDGTKCHNAVRSVCGNLGWWDWCVNFN